MASEEDPGFKKGKTVEQVVHDLVETISRNGNFLINIGPRADGTIPEWQVQRLRAMGEWLELNGDAIYGTRYWKEFEQESERLAFTTKGKALYAIKLETPATPFTVEATAGWEKQQVKSVNLLGSRADVDWEMTPEGLRITPPEDLGSSKYAWSFKIATDQEQHDPDMLIQSANEALKNTGHVNLDGHAPKK
jgi:alpha-L-fucosidase